MGKESGSTLGHIGVPMHFTILKRVSGKNKQKIKKKIGNFDPDL